MENNNQSQTIQAHKIGRSTILNCDVLDGLKSLESESVDLSVCSPPYWGLRDYGVEGQYGLESTFHEYVSKIVGVYHEVKRVLKSSGSIFLNIGDTYSGGGGNSSKYSRGPNSAFPQNSEDLFPEDSFTKDTGLEPKNLCMIPERIALGMQEDGWILRNKIIWYKPNHMPSSVQDRFANSFEFVYFFSKSRKYFFNLDAVRVPHSITTHPYAKDGVFQAERHDSEKSPAAQTSLEASLTWGYASKFKDAHRNPSGKNPGDLWEIEDDSDNRKFEDVPDSHEFFGSPRAREAENRTKNFQLSRDGFHGKEGLLDKGHSGYYYKDGTLAVNPAGKNPGDVWSIVTEPFPEAHFATYPTKLVEICIRAGCPEEVCKKCGKPREAINESYNPTRTRLIGEGQDSEEGTRGRAGETITRTIGYSDCGCNAGFDSGIVLDPFVGSGTTLEVAESLNRKGIGIELNEKYLPIIFKRLERFRGQERLFS